MQRTDNANKQSNERAAKRTRTPLTTDQLRAVTGGLGASTYPRWERAAPTWQWE